MKALCVNTSKMNIALRKGEVYNVRYCTIDSINVFIPFYNDWFTYCIKNLHIITLFTTKVGIPIKY